MLKSVKKSKTLVVRSISQGAPRVGKDGQRRPGNMLINGQWFSAIEFRNLLLGAKLPLDLPLTCYIGASATYNELEITQEMLDVAKLEGKEGHIEVINGREITYKQVGKNNVELNWDWSTITVSDSAVNIAKIMSILGTGRQAQAPTTTTAPAPATQRETIADDHVAEPTEVNNADGNNGHANLAG